MFNVMRRFTSEVDDEQLFKFCEGFEDISVTVQLHIYTTYTFFPFMAMLLNYFCSWLDVEYCHYFIYFLSYYKIEKHH